VLSTKEKSIGISRFENGRLTFPEVLPIPDEEPLLLETADLKGDGNIEIVFISRIRSGGSSRYVIRALQHGADGKWQPFPLGSAKTSQLPLDLSDAPTCLRAFGGGKGHPTDFLLFQGTDQPPLVLSAKPDGSVTAAPGNAGLRLGNVGPGAVFIADESVPTILVSQDNFARRLERGDDGMWRVADQYNASEGSAKVAGAALVDLDGKPGTEVVLVDTGIRKLRVLRKEKELYRPWKEIELGSFPYDSLRVADLNGDGRPDLLLIGRGRFAVLYAGKSVPALNELATYETKLQKTFFSDAVAGDLTGNGRQDIAMIDTQSHYVEVLSVDKQNRPHHAFHFKVFEEKSFAEGREGGTEPRESAIADVTGDGRADLILLVHDRVLVYPQDDGK
jgi:hypothetical protein